MTERRRLAIVSDLHMATPRAPGGDPFADDRAFAQLLGALAGRHIPTRLVLLGDTFDLVLAGRGGLDAVAAAHPAVFDALAGFAATGHEIEVVPGNHDIDLLRATARERLRRLVGAPITFRPWIVHVPGVLYAEHGQQHHAINHFHNVLGEAVPPPALCLDEARVRAAGVLRAPVLVSAGARAGAGALRARRLAALRRHEQGLRRHALELGLPAEVLVEVDRRAAPTALRMARRGDFMPAAARSVSDVLAGAGAATAFCVFGHTHVAADMPLRPRPRGPRYLNAGTWSSLVRRGRDGALDRRRWVEIEYGGGAPPTAALRHWEPAG